jgi:hypothetical protein
MNDYELEDQRIFLNFPGHSQRSFQGWVLSYVTWKCENLRVAGFLKSEITEWYRRGAIWVMILKFYTERERAYDLRMCSVDKYVVVLSKVWN